MKIYVKSLFLSCALLLGCVGHPRREPYRFYIPKDYLGWVQIEFKVAAAPQLENKSGYRIVKFPAEGVLRTSSTMEDGWAKDEYFSYSGNEIVQLSDGHQTGVINAGATGVIGSDETGLHFWRFFVGSYDKYLKYAYSNQVNPRIGPISE